MVRVFGGEGAEEKSNSTLYLFALFLFAHLNVVGTSFDKQFLFGNLIHIDFAFGKSLLGQRQLVCAHIYLLDRFS